MINKYLLFFSITVIFTLILPIYFGGVFENVFQIFQHNANKKETTSKFLMTPEELAKYTGLDGSPGMYLSILGKIYDVKEGEKHYGPDSSYNYFVGRDGSKSFVTGIFDSSADNDVLALKPSEIRSLVTWSQFYETRYRFVGYLVGIFYDASGVETEYLQNVYSLVEIAEIEHKNSELQKIKYPPCNVEWTAEAFTRVWCTRESGGISREWVGVPRKYFEAGASDWRCACIDVNNLDVANISEFDDCDRDAVSCTYNVE